MQQDRALLSLQLPVPSAPAAGGQPWAAGGTTAGLPGGRDISLSDRGQNLPKLLEEPLGCLRAAEDSDGQ